jgi:hypothetical protein
LICAFPSQDSCHSPRTLSKTVSPGRSLTRVIIALNIVVQWTCWPAEIQTRVADFGNKTCLCKGFVYISHSWTQSVVISSPVRTYEGCSLLNDAACMFCRLLSEPSAQSPTQWTTCLGGVLLGLFMRHQNGFPQPCVRFDYVQPSVKLEKRAPTDLHHTQSRPAPGLQDTACTSGTFVHQVQLVKTGRQFNIFIDSKLELGLRYTPAAFYSNTEAEKDRGTIDCSLQRRWPILTGSCRNSGSCRAK